MNKVAEVTSLAALNLSLQMDYTITYAVIASCYDTLVTQEQMISMFQLISTNGPHSLPPALHFSGNEKLVLQIPHNK